MGSRNIPLEIQRRVRQRCGFGCVICGMPLYEYDHMKEWAVHHVHIEEYITLLCDFHHKQVTNGLISREQVFDYNANPYNIQKGNSESMPLHFSGKTCTVVIGGNSFRQSTSLDTVYFYPIMVDNLPIIGFVIQDKHLLLNVVQFDEFNEPIFRIINNELSYSVSPWDIELKGNRLNIRNKPRSFFLAINFFPPNKIEIERGLFYCNGVLIEVSKEKVTIRGKDSDVTLSGNKSVNCAGGIIIGKTSRISGFYRADRVRRF